MAELKVCGRCVHFQQTGQLEPREKGRNTLFLERILDAAREVNYNISAHPESAIALIFNNTSSAIKLYGDDPGLRTCPRVYNRMDTVYPEASTSSPCSDLPNFSPRP